MYELALFAGAGGGLLATKHLLGWRTLCYVEREPYCVEVLKARIGDGLLDDAPIWGDVREFRRDNTECAAFIDELAQVDNLIITAGFPCQPFSCAGKQQGKDDERNMWPETARIIREVKPAAVLLENVSGLVSSGYILTVLDDLAKAGYAALPPVRLAASNVGANHRRRRYWIVAYSKSAGLAQRNSEPGREAEIGWTTCGPKRCCGEMAHANGSGRGKSERDLCQGQLNPVRRGANIPDAVQVGRNGRSCIQKAAKSSGRIPTQGESAWWATESGIRRVANGVAHRVDRLKAIGNGQVPAVVARVWELLTCPST